jgi:hypothetical protein
MPGTTDRAKGLKALYRARKRILIEPEDSDTDAVDEEMQTNLEMTAAILSRRCLSRPTKYRNNGFNADVQFQAWITDNRYVVFVHMTRDSFLYALKSLNSIFLFDTLAGMCFQ